MKIKKYLTIPFAAFAILVFMCPSAVIAGVGISPSDIVAGYLLPGSNFSKTFTVSRGDPVEDMRIDIEVTEGDEIKGWTTFTPGSGFIAPKGEQQSPFVVNINAPSGVKLGDYNGVITIKSIPISKEKASDVSTISSAAIRVKLTVIDKEISQYEILSIQVPKIKKGDPISAVLKLKNEGNTPAKPAEIHMDVISLFSKDVLESHVISEIGSVKPFLTDGIGEILIQSPTKLDIGQYWIDVTAYGEKKEILKNEKVMLEIEEKIIEQTTEKAVEKTIGEEAEKGFDLTKGLYIFTEIILVSLLVVFIFKRKSAGKKTRKNK
ncbi:MAG: hypothetical protein ABIG69_14290 [Bacteroidota bacterium]|nr:hypothetical protein [Patescibacteria group bacterium]MBU1730516.1 hypothetical protein [Patescibacteria group bacterium]MBU1956359.1 hypothetical protein [Patescibacteria group bacterium]